MVHGAKWQYSNRIISGKPADATRANALPFNVGSKKSGGFANRLLSVAQPSSTPGRRVLGGYSALSPKTPLPLMPPNGDGGDDGGPDDGAPDDGEG